MKSYKDVKRRIMALVVAAATVLSSITISFNSQAEGTAGVRSGGALAQVFKAEFSGGTYVQLEKVELNLHLQEGQTIDIDNCTATIYRNLTDVSTPESGIACGAAVTISPVSTSGENVNVGEQLVTITPKDGPVYLTNGETYSVVVTFQSNMDDIVYSTIEGNGAYIRDPGNPGWAGLSFGVMTPKTTTPVDSATGETFDIKLTPPVVCVDKADVGGGAKNFEFEAALTPAYQRTVKYTPVANEAFSVDETGAVSFTGNACGTAQVTASVDGAGGGATAQVTVVEATLKDDSFTASDDSGKPCFVYTGEKCEPGVMINGVEVNPNEFDVNYENNIAAGENTASVIITGKTGNYVGYSRKIPFTIKPIKITEGDVKSTSAIYTIDTNTDTVTSAIIPVEDGDVTLICDNEHHDFDVVATKTDKSVIKEDGKLYYTYDVTVTGTYNGTTGNSETEGALTTTVEAPAEKSDDGMINISTLLNVELINDTYTYTGFEIIPDFEATLANTKYNKTNISDIATVTGSTEASKTATVTFTGIEENGYTGSVTIPFVIDKCSLNQDWNRFILDVDKDAVTKQNIYIKTGDPINPKVKLTFKKKKEDGSEVLEVLDSDDYSVEYLNCINPGQMTIKIKGNGNFTDTHSDQYKIVGNLKTDVSWSIEADGKQYGVDKNDFSTDCKLFYTGSAQEVTVNGKIGGNSLKSGEPSDPEADFSVKYSDNINPDDTAKAIITGKGDYAGQKVTITYKIIKAPLTNFGKLQLDKDKWIYTGKAIEPECTIGDDGNAKVDKDDYDLIYEKNVNAGTAKVTAKAKPDSNYTGSLSKNFTINPRNLSDPDSGVVVTVEKEIYDWFFQTPDVTLTYNNDTPLDQSDDMVLDKGNYDVKYENNIGPGEGTVKITGKENLTGNATGTFDIVPRDLENLEWNVGGAGWNGFGQNSTSAVYKVVYSGLDERPSIELRDGDKKLVQGEDYRVTYRNNINPSSEKAHIDITMINGYASEDGKDNPTFTVDFEVIPKDISATNSGIEVTYDEENKTTTVGDKVFPNITIVDKGLRSGTKTLEKGVDYVLEEKVSKDPNYNLSTSGATKIAIVRGMGCYAGTFETKPYAIGNEIGTSLTEAGYVVRLKNPHTGEIANPSNDVARFSYLGEDDKPIPILCSTDKYGNVTEVMDENIETYGNITYTSSKENIHSVYTPENIVTVSLEGTGQYYGVVSTKYALIATTIEISSQDNNVNKASSKELGEFDSTTNRTVCKVPYTGNAIGLKEIAEDLTLKHTFSESKIKELKYDTDYSLELATDSEKSSASIIGDTVTVTASGMGNYNGFQDYTYQIVQRDLKQCIVTGNGGKYPYTGERIDPTIKVIDPGRNDYELKKDTDYEIIYSGDATTPGRQGFKIEGRGVYQGTLTKTNNVDLYFTIDSKEFTDDTITIDNFSSTMAYTGDDANPVIQTGIVVKYKGVAEPLKENKDYTVIYDPEKPIEPGKVTMTIKGTGAYKGSVAREYYIQPNMSTDVTVTIAKDKDNNEKTFFINPDGTTNIEDNDFILTCNGDNLVLGVDYVIDKSECKEPGKPNVYFTGINDKDKNYGKYAGKATVPITLYGDLSHPDVEVNCADKSYVYTGSSVGPDSVEVYYGKLCRVDASNYTITGDKGDNVIKGVEAGKVIRTISPNDGSYYLKDKKKTFTYDILYDLSEANTELVIEGSTPSYNNDEDGVRPSVKVTSHRKELTPGTDYEVSYSNNKNAGTAKVTINPVPGKSMNSQSKTFDILPINISSGTKVTWKDPEMQNVVKYKGTEWRPEVEVERGSVILTDGVDYVVNYANNKDVVPGEKATVTIIGKGNYTGSTEKEFTIEAASLQDDAKITVENTYYNGGKADPKIEVSLNGYKLTKGTDYDCVVGSEAQENLNDPMYPTDKAYVEFEGIGPNFDTGSFKKYFTINPVNLTSSGRITLEDNTAEYNGQVISTADVEEKIKVVCKVDGQDKPYTLVKDTDYTITPDFEGDIQDVGTYKFLVMAEEGYGFTGTKEVTFEVTPRDLDKHVTVTLLKKEKGEILDENTFMPYNGGDEVKPYVSAVTETGADALKKDGKPYELVEGKDYEVSYEYNRNSASKDSDNPPTVVIKGLNNYKGTEKRIAFNIGTSIEGANVLLKDVPVGGYTYNGKVQKPNLDSVTLNGETLIRGEDYSLTEEGDFINAGEKRIDIVGINAYYGTAFGTYTINPAPVTDNTDNIEIQLGGLDYDEETNTYSATYTGSPIVPTVTVYDHAISEKPLEKDKDYTVTVNNNVNAGPAATVTVTLSANYSDNTQKVKTFTILPKDIAEDFEIKFVDNKKKYDYEGREIVPDIKVVSKAGISPSVELKEDEYSISLSNNVNAGMANVTVKGAEKNYTGTLSGEFMIVAVLDESNITIEEQFYTGEKVMPSVTIYCGGNYLVQEDDSNKNDFHVENTWSESDPFHGTAIITSNRDYYICKEPIKKDYTLAYSEEYLQVTGFANEYIYTRSEIKPSFKITDLSGNEISSKKFHYDPKEITYKNRNTGKADCINVGIIDATIPVSVEGQEEILSLTATYEIRPKNINDCSITMVNENTYNGSAIEPAVSIVYNGHELTKNQEFTESYSNNINPGTATVVLQGQGNYTGQCSPHFKIKPACMINLTASPISESAIRIEWARNAKVTGYEIFSADGRKKYGTTTGNFYIVDGLNTATSYSFKVRSYVTINGATSYGDALQVTSYTKVGKVSVTGSSNAPGTATLTWNRYTSVAGYEIYRSTSSNGNYKKIADVPNAYGTYTDKKVRSGKTYYYKVRAYKPINGAYSYGDFSEEIKITIK